MTELLWLLLPLALLAGAWLVYRQRAARRGIADSLERSEEHEAMFNALTDWLQEERICRAMIEHRVADRRGLVELQAALPAYTEEKTRAVMACLLASRDVRKVIAGHLERTMKIPRRDAMAPLLQWSKFQGREAMSS